MRDLTCFRLQPRHSAQLSKREASGNSSQGPTGNVPSPVPVTVDDVDVVQKCKVVLRVKFRVGSRCAAFCVRPAGEILGPSKVPVDAGAPDLGWTEATPPAVEGRLPAVTLAPLRTGSFSWCRSRESVLLDLSVATFPC